jgi:hypothetical protein
MYNLKNSVAFGLYSPMKLKERKNAITFVVNNVSKHNTSYSIWPPTMMIKEDLYCSEAYIIDSTI